MAHKEVAAAAHQSQELPRRRLVGGAHHPGAAGLVVQEDAPLPRPADPGAAPAQHLQQIGVEGPVPVQAGQSPAHVVCHVPFPPVGRRMTKLVRRPSVSARMEPPWRSTISRAMARPSPAPPVRVERA